jgi:hypothetical protein
MTVLDFMYKMAARAKDLTSKPVDELRLSVAEHATTYHGAIGESQHMKKGDLVEAILIEEFEEEAKKIDDAHDD